MNMFSTIAKQQGPIHGRVQIRAGRTKLEPGSSETKRKVVAIPAKGLLCVKKTDGMAELKWKNMQTNVVEEELFLLTGDAFFHEVKECTDGKVFMLKFNSTSECRCYWIQDGSPDVAKDLCKKLNDIVGNNSLMMAAGGAPSRPNRAAASGSATHTPLNSRFVWENQNPNRRTLRLNDFTPEDIREMLASNLLRGIRQNDTSEQISEEAMEEDVAAQIQRMLNEDNATPATKITFCDLNDVFKSPGVTEAIIKNKERFGDKVIDFPEGAEKVASIEKEVESTAQFPEFHNAVHTFSFALSSGQLGSVLQQFGLPENVLAASLGGDPLDFANALTAAEAEFRKFEIKEEADSDKHQDNDKMDAE